MKSIRSSVPVCRTLIYRNVPRPTGDGIIDYGKTIWDFPRQEDTSSAVPALRRLRTAPLGISALVCDDSRLRPVRLGPLRAAAAELGATFASV
jgi:hypothetical protein